MNKRFWFSYHHFRPGRPTVAQKTVENFVSRAIRLYGQELAGVILTSAMGRALRIQYPGALYHITSRGNERNKIFLDDSDRIKFLGIIGLSMHRCCPSLDVTKRRQGMECKNGVVS